MDKEQLKKARRLISNCEKARLTIDRLTEAETAAATGKVKIDVTIYYGKEATVIANYPSVRSMLNNMIEDLEYFLRETHKELVAISAELDKEIEILLSESEEPEGEIADDPLEFFGVKE